MARLWHSLGALTLLASPAAADDLLQRPEACKPVVTVQSRGCMVETTLRCEGMAPVIWRSESYDDKGLNYVSTFDENFVQIEVRNPQVQRGFSYDLSRSFSTAPSEVVKTGKGEERTFGVVWEPGIRLNIMAYHTLERVDPPLVVSGTALGRLRLYGTRTLSPPLGFSWQDYMNYLDPVSGALLGGENLSPDDEGKLSLDGQPVELSRPGEPGFDAQTPKFDCATLSFNETDEKADKS